MPTAVEGTPQGLRMVMVRLPHGVALLTLHGVVVVSRTTSRQFRPLAAASTPLLDADAEGTCSVEVLVVAVVVGAALLLFRREIDSV